jgi:hypothetical protein
VALTQKFIKNKALGVLLMATKGKRLVEYVRGKQAASNHWGGKLVATMFKGITCTKLVGGEHDGYLS